MALTPMDIHNKEFHRKLRGFDVDEVDEFLDQVIRAFEALISENNGLKEQCQALSDRLEQYRSLEDTLNRTLVVAQEAADEVRNNARREADLIIQEARLQSERIVEGGKVKSQRLMEEREELARLIESLRSQTRAALKAQIDIIDRMLPNAFPEVAAASHEEPTAGASANEPRSVDEEN